jgi:hypothetical protein
VVAVARRRATPDVVEADEPDLVVWSSLWGNARSRYTLGQ